MTRTTGFFAKRSQYQDTDWMDAAACTDHPNPDIFFADRGSEKRREAALVCRSCPVLDACAHYGVTEEYGTWGNMSRDERRILNGLMGNREGP